MKIDRFLEEISKACDTVRAESSEQPGDIDIVFTDKNLQVFSVEPEWLQNPKTKAWKHIIRVRLLDPCSIL